MSRVVLKFGGTSVSSPEAWDTMARLIGERSEADERPFLVLSAFSGVTGLLESALAEAVEGEGAARAGELRERHQAMATALGLDGIGALEADLTRAAESLDGVRLLREATPRVRASVLALGELMSTRLGVEALRARGVDATWLDAREHLICGGGRGGPGAGSDVWREYLAATCPTAPDPDLQRRLDGSAGVLVTQGFVARNPAGETVVLGRGGSDTSAALFAVMLEAERLEIWTDVAGMFTADPRLVPSARLLRRLSHQEAQEIASTGSRVLHPGCIPALRAASIPVHIRSTLDPEREGTVVLRGHRAHSPQLKAISVQRDVTLVTLEAVGMWHEVGFLAEVFRIFAEEDLSVDMVSTSETNLTVSLDPQGDLTGAAALERLVGRLRSLGDARLIPGCAAVSLVGNDIRAQLHRLGPIFEAFEEHPVHLMSQAANDLNLTFVVDGDRADAIVLEIHHHLIGQAVDATVFGPPEDRGAGTRGLWSPHAVGWRPGAGVRGGAGRAAEGGAGAAWQDGPGVAEREAPPWWVSRREELLEICAREGAAYVYDLATVRSRARSLAELDSVDRVFYAMKANGHPELLRAIHGEGLGIECVSRGELDRSFASVPGLEPGDVLFTPNFAPRAEYADALERRVHVTLDSLYPLRAWPELFRGREVLVRVDPGRGRGHHRNVRTAGGHTKFGVPLFELDELSGLLEEVGCELVGLHLHAGSGVTDEDHWREAAELLFRLADELGGVRAIDVGGGLGIPSRVGDAGVDLSRLDELLRPLRAGRSEEIWLEPGRFLVADAGVLVARVTQTKGKGQHRYVGIETGMNSLLRPALYGAYHEILNLTRLEEPAGELVSVVGPICETTDRLGHDRALPVTEEGDVLVILDTGAYGRVMASEYNLRSPAVEVVV